MKKIIFCFRQKGVWYGRDKCRYKKMESYISNINLMKSCWSKKARPSAEGEGRTVEEMELLAGAYEELYDSMIVLVENTVSYFENVINPDLFTVVP